MNRPAASTSAIIVACPTTRAPPLVSSASVEMASKPRKDSTATDSALKMMLARNTLGSKKGRRLQCDPLTPRLTAIAPRTTKTASTMSSMTRKSRLARAVVSIPSMLTTVLNVRKPITHSGCGIDGSTACRATAPTT
jgi:hypothetical protein